MRNPAGRGGELHTMRLIAAALVAATAVSLLAGCSDTSAAPVAQSTTAAPARTTPTSAPSRQLKSLPKAPPLNTWVMKGSDFQQTLDLKMQTAMVERLDMPFAEADEDWAHALAYYMCSALRRHENAGEALAAIYPNPDASQQTGITVAAQAYCLDTV